MMLSSLFLALHKFVEERMMMMVAITHFMIVKNAYERGKRKKGCSQSKKERVSGTLVAFSSSVLVSDSLESETAEVSLSNDSVPQRNIT